MRSQKMAREISQLNCLERGGGGGIAESEIYVTAPLSFINLGPRFQTHRCTSVQFFAQLAQNFGF